MKERTALRSSTPFWALLYLGATAFAPAVHAGAAVTLGHGAFESGHSSDCGVVHVEEACAVCGFSGAGAGSGPACLSAAGPVDRACLHAPAQRPLRVLRPDCRPARAPPLRNVAR